MPAYYNKAAEKGFTLVELGMTLVIIGLLIGGVLKGVELITNAKATQTIRQVNNYKAATITFKDSYGALPGDIPAPQEHLPDCTTSPCSDAGNNNGILDPQSATLTSSSMANEITFRAGGDGKNFWLHLARARMITGIDASGATSSPFHWGVELPQGAYEGTGFYCAYFNGIKKNILVLHGMDENDPALLGSAAAMIDRKIDDGKPYYSGNVMVMGNGVSIGTTCISAAANGAKYIEDTKEGGCQLAFALDN